ncbi:hypothetical protein [Algihabitans albus]|uniref:hypothetical protein n=1 Tax=Algihabitans albus TaxID=2164067 RepID=UPI000E5D8EED|nr:hypothetical protein [Algihabitans albus]
MTGKSYLSWGAVLGGSVVALAISAFLIQFGTTAGLSVGDPVLSDGSPSWNVVIAGLWILLVALASSAAGGYLAGRMRRGWGDATAHEVEFRDGAHGLVVWAVASIAIGSSAFLFTAVSSLATTAAPAGAAIEVSEAVQDLTANISVILAFSSAAAAALGAGAAWSAAKLGGEHRDKGVDVNTLVPIFGKRR